MKIISTHSNRFTCHHCKTVAEYEINDIKYKEEPPGYDEYENRETYYVSCPTCSTPHNIHPTSYEKTTAISNKNLNHY